MKPPLVKRGGREEASSNAMGERKLASGVRERKSFAESLPNNLAVLDGSEG